MTSKTTTNKFSPEAPGPYGAVWFGSGARGVSMPRAGGWWFDFIEEFGCTPQTLHEWVKTSEHSTAANDPACHRMFRTRSASIYCGEAPGSPAPAP